MPGTAVHANIDIGHLLNHRPGLRLKIEGPAVLAAFRAKQEIHPTNQQVQNQHAGAQQPLRTQIIINAHALGEMDQHLLAGPIEVDERGKEPPERTQPEPGGSLHQFAKRGKAEAVGMSSAQEQEAVQAVIESISVGNRDVQPAAIMGYPLDFRQGFRKASEMLHGVVAHHHVHAAVAQRQLMGQPAHKASVRQRAPGLESSISREGKIHSHDPTTVAEIVEAAATATQVQYQFRLIQLRKKLIQGRPVLWIPMGCRRLGGQSEMRRKEFSSKRLDAQAPASIVGLLMLPPSLPLRNPAKALTRGILSPLTCAL